MFHLDTLLILNLENFTTYLHDNFLSSANIVANAHHLPVMSVR